MKLREVETDVELTMRAVTPGYRIGKGFYSLVYGAVLYLIDYLN